MEAVFSEADLVVQVIGEEELNPGNTKERTDFSSIINRNNLGSKLSRM